MAWLTKKEAAEYLSVCESTIDNLESRGLLKGHRLYLGDKRPIVRYRQSDLDDLFLKRQRGRPRREEVSSYGVKPVNEKELKQPIPTS